jgi:hypothetical protein
MLSAKQEAIMSDQPDELSGLKKLLVALEGDEHSKMAVLQNGNDVTKSWIEALRDEITALEICLARLKRNHG